MYLTVFVSFTILINGYATYYFRHGRGIRKGFPLAPLLFLIVAEGLGRDILDSKQKGHIASIRFGDHIFL